MGQCLSSAKLAAARSRLSGDRASQPLNLGGDGDHTSASDDVPLMVRDSAGGDDFAGEGSTKQALNWGALDLTPLPETEAPAGLPPTSDLFAEAPSDAFGNNGDEQQIQGGSNGNLFATNDFGAGGAFDDSGFGGFEQQPQNPASGNKQGSGNPKSEPGDGGSADFEERSSEMDVSEYSQSQEDEEPSHEHRSNNSNNRSRGNRSRKTKSRGSGGGGKKKPSSGKSGKGEKKRRSKSKPS